MSPGDPSTPEPVEQLRRELEAEKQRIAVLEGENAALLAATRRAGGARSEDGAVVDPGRRSHRFWVALLLVIATVLTPITIIAVFVKQQINDTSRYVQTVEPLASNPAVQAYVAEEVSDQLFERVDIAKYVKDALPRRADVLAGPMTSALQGFARQAVERILATDQFQELWVEANEVAHAQLVNVLTGKQSGEIAATENGAVTVDLSAVTKLVQEELESTGIDLFSDIRVANIGGTITIFESNDLYQARTALRILNTVAFVLPFVVLACFAGAILLSRKRRRGFVASAVSFAIGALVLALALFVGRGAYLNAATGGNLPYDAAAAVYDTLLRSLHTSVRAVLYLSAIVITAVFFAGPSRFAVWFRIRVREGANWLGRQSEEAEWGWLAPNAFVVSHKRGMRVIVAAIAFLVLFRWSHPTPSVIVYVGLVTLFVLALVELFGREPLPVDEAPEPRGRGVAAGSEPAPASG